MTEFRLHWTMDNGLIKDTEVTFFSLKEQLSN